jgi:mono/diheme cytochrome c family protein
MNQFLVMTKGLAITALLLSGCNSFAKSEIVADKASRVQAGSTNSAVTPVTGASWLTHLNRPFGETSMGKTWRLGPAPGDETLPRQAGVRQAVAAKAVTVKGSDLYRLNCEGCHGESGLGSPPEINSVINPVRATSVALVMERMKNTGMDISRADAATLAQQSSKALLQRLHNGGENMPAFPHLSETEIRSLVTYLRKLAGVPGAERERSTVRESAARVGELIVKSTCHTCHSAVGLDPGPQQLLDGAIPPLTTLTTRKSQPEFIRKVTQGAPILMGTPPLLCRGRMPVFYYLSEEEAADVYLYLTVYPPSEESRSEPAIALS